MNDSRTICWERLTADLHTSTEVGEPTIIDIVVDGHRCIYIADAQDDGI